MGETVSGEDIAKTLKISRAAVNKQIQALRKKGYVIHGQSNSGYSLISKSDLLSPDEFEKYLTAKNPFKFYYFNEINSTQEKAKAFANSGGAEWDVVISETQTSGRGRLGRKWMSPPGGIWFSVILKPELMPDSVPQITLVACLALRETIKDLLKIDTLIKWPNDLTINGRKIAGILTEMSAEVGKTNWVVLGIGVNVNNEIPSGLQETALSLCEAAGKKVNRQELFVSFLKRFKMMLTELTVSGFGQFKDRYNSHSAVNGKPIRVDTAGHYATGIAEKTDEFGRLMVRTDTGAMVRLVAGEITLK